MLHRDCLPIHIFSCMCAKNPVTKIYFQTALKMYLFLVTYICSDPKVMGRVTRARFGLLAADDKEDRGWLALVQRNCITELLHVRVPLFQQHQRFKALQTRSGQTAGLSRRNRWCKAACLSDSKGFFVWKHASCLVVKALLTPSVGSFLFSL